LVGIDGTLRATGGGADVFVTGGAKFTRSGKSSYLILKFTVQAIGAHGCFTHVTFSSSAISTGIDG